MFMFVRTSPLLAWATGALADPTSLLLFCSMAALVAVLLLALRRGAQEFSQPLAAPALAWGSFLALLVVLVGAVLVSLAGGTSV
jgi:hypothetical protein